MAQCLDFIPGNNLLLPSVFLAGLVGSISHCSVMCAPLAASQMLNLRTNGEHQSQMAYYHAGRIVTYMMLGAAATTIAQWLFSGTFQSYARSLLLIAGLVFFMSALLPRKTHACCSTKTQHAFQWIDHFPSVQLTYLFRGLLMGFMPCGMLFAILLAVATLPTLLEASLVMMIFGLATVPVLQLVGYSALRLNHHYPRFSLRLSRSVMALNGLFLCGLGLNILHIN